MKILERCAATAWRHPFYTAGLVDWLPPPTCPYDWECLTINPAALQMIDDNRDKIQYSVLPLNPAAVHLLPSTIDVGNSWGLFLSHHPLALRFVDKRNNQFYWENVSRNCFRTQFLIDNIDKLSSNALSTNPYAIKVLEQFPKMVNAEMIQYNLATLHIISGLDPVDSWAAAVNPMTPVDTLKRLHGTRYGWNMYKNPAIFEPKSYHYDVIRATYAALHAELLAAVCRPTD